VGIPTHETQACALAALLDAPYGRFMSHLRRHHPAADHVEALVWLAVVLLSAITLTVLLATQGSPPMTADSAATVDSVTGRLSVVHEPAP
jgi:hypothetical protein